MDVSIVDYPVTVRVRRVRFTFRIDAEARSYKVRPVNFPEARLKACSGARWSLLHDGKSRFIWVASHAEPTTLESAHELARKWAKAIMEDEFPRDWPRDPLP